MKKFEWERTPVTKLIGLRWLGFTSSVLTDLGTQSMLLIWEMFVDGIRAFYSLIVWIVASSTPRKRSSSLGKYPCDFLERAVDRGEDLSPK